MHIKSILAGAAIALVAGVGSASAADQFSTLEGIAAEAMAPRAMGEVRGADHATLTVTPGGLSGDEFVPLPEPDATDIFEGFPGPNIGRATTVGQATPAALFSGL